jgi:hypothetical protein
VYRGSIGSSSERGEPRLPSVVPVADRDGAVEPHNRAVGEPDELVVPLDDRHPVGLVGCLRGGVQGRAIAARDWYSPSGSRAMAAWSTATPSRSCRDATGRDSVRLLATLWRRRADILAFFDHTPPTDPPSDL